MFNVIKDIYYKNKKVVFSILIVIILIIGFIFNFKERSNNTLINQERKYELVLFGSNEVTVYKGENYQEPGFYAIEGSEFITSEVEIINQVDTSKIGTYQITYILKDIKKTRIVNIIENPNTSIKDIKFELIGSEKITLYKGEIYNELGYTAYDKNNNDISNQVLVKGVVDTKNIGTYCIEYSISLKEKIKTLKRIVEVIEEKEELNINFDYSKTITNQFVLVNIKVTGDNFSYLKLPDLTISNGMDTTYQINKNGSYSFYVYDTNGNYKVKSLTINNIDNEKPTATCKATTYFDKTEITVLASDNVGVSKYVYENTYSSNSNTYTINKELDSVNVVVYDTVGNKTSVNCDIEKSYIEMHFIAGVSDDDAILIRTSDKVIMIDGGRYEASDKIVSYLKNIGVFKIDALIGSHVHWNHVQSHAKILENFIVDKVYYSVDILNCISLGHCESNDNLYIKDELQKRNITPVILKSKSYLKIGDMELYFIGPVRGKLTTYQNANSLVFILKYGNKKFMFTGDTPDKYMDTTKFLQEASYFNMNLDIDVLKWPHHGYEDLTDEFFKSTTPEYAIMPNCCKCESYYPSSVNKKLMTKYGTSYYQVCDSKNIVLKSDGKRIVVYTNQEAINWKK